MAFSASIALMWYGNRLDFAVYSVFWTYQVLVVSIANSAFGVPAQILLTKAEKSTLRALLKADQICHTCVALVASLIGIACATQSPVILGVNSTDFALMCVVASLGWIKEVQRTHCIVDKDERRLGLASALALALFTALLLLSANFGLGIGLRSLLQSMVAANLASVLIIGLPILRGGSTPRAQYLAFVHKLLPGALHSLPGGILAWMLGQAYVTVVMVFAGPAAVATISAARLISVPAQTLQTALIRQFTGRVASLYAKESASGILAVIRAQLKSSALLHLFITAFTLVILLGLYCFGYVEYEESFAIYPLPALLVFLSGVRSLYVVTTQCAQGFVFSLKLTVFGSAVAISVMAVIVGLGLPIWAYFLPMLLSEATMLYVARQKVRGMTAEAK